MGRVFESLLDTVAGAVGSTDVRPRFEDHLTQHDHDDHERVPPRFSTPRRRPIVVFVTPNYRNELPNNAMIGELGAMQKIAHMQLPDGSQAIEVARWIPDGPHDLEGRLILVDPLAGTRNNSELIDGKGDRELHVRTDIDRVIAVIVRFPVSEAQFAQIHTVFRTYGSPELVADFSNAGLYMDMRYGASERERTYGSAPVTRPYSIEVLRQFDSVRVPTQKLADQIKRDLRGAA